MSIETRENELDCDFYTGCEAINMIIQPREKDLGEFSVRRSLPSKNCKTVGPWVFFDHFGPAHFTAGSGINVRPHPHINLATVTYLFEGEILHRDSLGSYAVIKPGAINLMVAGKGITHSERERPEVKNIDHTLHGLQLWLALPEKNEEMDPAFYHHPAESIPTTQVNGVALRVLIGTAYGLTSPVLTFAQTLYVEAHMQVGQTLEVVNCEERAIYVVEGEIKINDILIPEFTIVILSAAEKVILEATKNSRIALIGGEKIGKRYLDWNFVSSRKERVAQAKEDWRLGQFPKVVDDEKEFIPLPSS